MMKLRSLIAASLVSCCLLTTVALAQGAGQLGPGELWGQPNAVRGPASPTTVSQLAQLGVLTTYYVNSIAPNDSANCLSVASPCKTLQGAWNKMAVSNYGLGGAAISIADGTDSAGLIAVGAWMGAGHISITGNVGSPGNVIISTGAANALTVQNVAVTLSGMELRTSGSFAGLVSKNGADVSFSNMRFGGDGTGQHMTATNGGRIHCIGNYQVVAGGQSHIHAFNRGFFDAPLGGCSATLVGTPNFTSYFAGVSDGDIDFTGWTPAGTAATGPKFFAHDGGRIKSGGLGMAALPGNLPGSQRVLGQFDNFFGGPNAQFTANDNTVDGPVPNLASQIQTVGADNTLGGITMNAFGTGQTHVTGGVAFGTAAAPTVVNSTVPLASFGGRAYDGSAYGITAAIDINTIAGVTTSDHGGYITLRTVPTGSTTLTEQMRIGAGVGVGNGCALQGAGTLNLCGGALYNNGTAPTGTGGYVRAISPAITTPTGIVKGDVGLGNVDNTSDVTKWAATKTLTNTTYDTAGAGNSFSVNGVAATSNTGTGAVVRASNPVLVAPQLGVIASGDASNLTGTAPGLTAGDVANAAVIAKVLTGYVSGPGTVSSGDSILSAIQKINGNVGLKQATLTPGQLPGTTTNDDATAGNVGEYLFAGGGTIAGAGANTVTITIASPAVISFTGHGFSNTGTSPVVFTTTGALPTGIVSGTVYWSVPGTITAGTFQIASSAANALAGTAINTSGSQSGTHTGAEQIPLTTATNADFGAIKLTAGDWEVGGSVGFALGATTSVVYWLGWTATASATTDQQPGHIYIQNFSNSGAVLGNTVSSQFALPPRRITVANASTQIVYGSQQASFSVSTAAGYGTVWARRRR